ncbi:MAG: type II toxin-antitoxin system VapB family antitoxin [Candidatus Eremiobacteraeota bacterium]|nr:type II toxin-antitoxin system VapB family antitoxin [Candidatus Eremiobacteraeota bacterium]MBV8433784.1 type II toxin-antitoxin system VapB family antitoxin [Candidatus Eremiobacteraeota bacterium]MBV8583648.1 type II toxin-antitoxin system VapB family antitoxin [Candidatus Eremiobacteraeota bacterium]
MPRTTLILDERLVREARKATGIERKTDLVHAGLRALIAEGALDRLVAKGGSMPELQRVRRRRY